MERGVRRAIPNHVKTVNLCYARPTGTLSLLPGEGLDVLVLYIQVLKQIRRDVVRAREFHNGKNAKSRANTVNNTRLTSGEAEDIMAAARTQPAHLWQAAGCSSSDSSTEQLKA